MVELGFLTKFRTIAHFGFLGNWVHGLFGPGPIRPMWKTLLLALDPLVWHWTIGKYSSTLGYWVHGLFGLGPIRPMWKTSILALDPSPIFEIISQNI